MSYGKKIYTAACAELKRRKETAEAAAQAQTFAFYARCPQARELREQMASNAAKAARAVVGGSNVREELEKLKETGLRLKAAYQTLLRENGFSERALSPAYQCEHCRDSGFVDGRMCSCLKALQKSLAYEKLSMDVPLGECTFQTFSMDCYQQDARTAQQMQSILSGCQKYAENFRAHSPNLLFWGGNGLGKTHLSLAIAGEVLEKGFGVIYGSVQHFAVSLEKERFLNADSAEAADTRSQLISCDLLILDDLGVEFPSAYVSAALYNILDTRLLSARPTIISTNLGMRELEDRYGARLTSRLSGSYSKLEFLGQDFRYRKQQERQKL